MGWGLAGNIRGPAGSQGIQGSAGAGLLPTKLVASTRSNTLITAANITELIQALTANQRVFFRGRLLYTAAAPPQAWGSE